MPMVNITADRLTTPASSDSLWANFVAFARSENSKPISFGYLEPRKSDVRVDTTKWFWNGELCCNPWLKY
jgi:hypothetical protein